MKLLGVIESKSDGRDFMQKHLIYNTVALCSLINWFKMNTRAMPVRAIILWEILDRMILTITITVIIYCWTGAIAWSEADISRLNNSWLAEQRFHSRQSHVAVHNLVVYSSCRRSPSIVPIPGGNRCPRNSLANSRSPLRRRKWGGARHYSELHSASGETRDD